ncbi:hypothetical protein DQ238_03435 [Geodermatophilus sp. TF02-6]|uniref:hypothetical protein n=1 Tax=Geodermatophilus sp. TF02-6 TaxID=2250575 RepID=UPI000DE8F429|nr:hypothetical protein [Geodermatophilus sp. TF02-6]RBY82364.1 hypothetical protein DQ238_03435 [Geodermatophilus sp. TF02-6]
MTDSRTRRRTLPRTFAATRAVWGVCLAVLPGRTTRLLGVGRPEPRAWIVRVLGGRLIAQNAWVLLNPTRGRVLAGAAVDVLHAASMALVAACWPAYRRPASISAATAAASGLLGALTAPRAQP